MSSSRVVVLPLVLLLVALAASAQTVAASDQSVASDSPEGWAMRYFAGTTLMTSFGAAANLGPGAWNVAVDLGSIPQLTDAQQRVGFGGFKNEDLNKSPLFGRLRFALGLPGEWIAEVGYTPPLEIDGARPRNVFSAALGRRLLADGAFTLSLRALGQLGQVRGDITCPAHLAGIADPAVNPYACQAPSQDTFTTNYLGIDATAAWDAGEWQMYASAGVARTWLEVQVDAEVATTRDRSRLTSDGSLPWFTVGVRHDLDRRWSIAAEVLYVPLDVRRPPDVALDLDSLTSVRIQLRYAPD